MFSCRRGGAEAAERYVALTVIGCLSSVSVDIPIGIVDVVCVLGVVLTGKVC